MAGITDVARGQVFNWHADEIAGYYPYTRDSLGTVTYLDEHPGAALPMPGPEDPLEHMMWSGAARQAYPVLGGGSTDRFQWDNLQRLLSLMVVNPMGYSPDETGTYGWGELASIYQLTPASDIARQAQAWRAAGTPAKARLMELYYGGTERPSGETIDVIRQLQPKYGHGQTDVAMNPQLVSQMLARNTTERRRPRYKGGTVTTGLLTSPALGFKRTLGG
jgi:hypothetical protein